jgi:5-formyltetrahydrofolate cyclo-ligase
MPSGPPGHHGFIPSSDEEALRHRVKAELRKRMRGLRRALPASACSERSLRIVERLSSLEPIARATRIALFWPIEERHEVDLRPLDALLRRRGARVAYPSVDPETRAMVFRFVTHPDAMQEHGFGFREPSPHEPAAEPGSDGALEAIVVPALALDPSGHRIGYGAGYYDAALPSHAPPAVSVGVAFDFQLVAEVPATSADVALQWIVTDDRAMAADQFPARRLPPLP